LQTTLTQANLASYPRRCGKTRSLPNVGCR